MMTLKLPSREILQQVLLYEAKYGQCIGIINRSHPEAISELARQLAVKAFKAIDCQGSALIFYWTGIGTSFI
jgi:D-alanine-D-alanine ligase-like ATP-grasp enzyme